MTHDCFCPPHFYVSRIFDWPSRSSGLNFAPVWHLLVVNVPEINWKWFHILSCQNSIDGTFPRFFSSFSSTLGRRNSWSTPSLSSFLSPLRSELICPRWHSCRTVSTSTASSRMEQRIDSLEGSRYAFWDQMKSPQVNFNYQYAKCWPKVVHPRRFSRKQVYGETKKKASLIYCSYLVYEHRDACGAGPMGYEVSRNEYSVHWSTSRSHTHTSWCQLFWTKSYQPRPIVQIVGWTMIQCLPPLLAGYRTYYCVTSFSSRVRVPFSATIPFLGSITPPIQNRSNEHQPSLRWALNFNESRFRCLSVQRGWQSTRRCNFYK